MNTENWGISTDGNCVLQYLSNFPGEFISGMEIARRADGRERFAQDAHWAHVALAQLEEMKLVETDGLGRFRLPAGKSGTKGKPRKFIDPKLLDILSHSNRKIDLSGFGQ
jgi:hypothetical protein